MLKQMPSAVGVVVLAALVALVVTITVATTKTAPVAQAPPSVSPPDHWAEPDGVLPLQDFSTVFLGIYRKIMLIEDQIRKYSQKYDVDYDLARAVSLYESGGNANLTSRAGAAGYFQVMPATFRLMRVDTNIEAGVKYLGQMIRRFRREDFALAGYNAGPGRVVRGRLPLESLQYVLFVGQYRSVLKMYEPSIRYYAEQMSLETVQEGDGWWALSKRLGVSVLQLRMHNPFLSTRALRVGHLIAYPPAPRTDLFTSAGDDLKYRTRHGDNYLLLAFILGVDRDVMRETNGLWRLQTLPAGQTLRIPIEWKGKHTEHRVRAGEDLKTIAETLKSSPWRIIRDNNLFLDEQVSEGMVLRVRRAPPRPTYLGHRVQNGDTLGAIARRYGTTVRAIQAANNLGRRTLLRIGQQLRIPTRAADADSEPRPTYLGHRAQNGDTLGAIARRYGTTVRAIQAANNLGRRTLLRIGQQLRIPTRAADADSEPRPTYLGHRVQNGDTLGAIARRYGTTVRAIQAANNLGRRTLLRIGQQLRIPTRAADADSEPRPTYLGHRVQNGDTLGAIARRYGTTVRAIQAANNLGRRTLLRIGQQLRIPTRGAE